MNAQHIIRIALSVLLVAGSVKFFSTDSSAKAETVQVTKSVGICKLGSSC
jgi:hypothetical protein